MATIIAQRYVIQEKLGQGGMGIVYQVYDRLTTQIIALKQVLLSTDQLSFSSKGTHTDERVALADEFRTLASLRHPHIVSVLDYGFDEARQPFFTMNLLTGGQTLYQAARYLAPTEKLMLVVQVLQALAYLHRRGVIHRDLKPSNIMVVDGAAIVLDFGLAMVRSEAKFQDTQDFGGSIKYMAPELLKGYRASEASDLWSVGVMIYELLAKRYLYSETNMVMLMDAILSQTPDFEILEITPVLTNILRRLLAKKPTERYTDVSDVLRDLGNALQISIAESGGMRESFLQAARFVGRDTELNTLQNALALACQGQGSLWLVGGKSGVGKTRLLNELRIQALVNGVVVVRGQGIGQGGLAYQLWRDVLPLLILHIALNDFEARVLKDLVPHIGDLLGRPVEDAPELGGQDRQQRLILTIQTVLQRQTQPVLLIFEDLQWVDESRLVLQHIQSQLADLPILIVGSYRHDEQPDLPAEFTHAQVLLLHRLSSDAVGELSESMLGAVGRQVEILDLIIRETEGNTFFIVEVVRALAEQAGTLGEVGQVNLPAHIFTGGMEQLLQTRLAHIAPQYQPLLELAAVTGRELDLNLLAFLAPATDLEAWLYAGQTAAVLEVENNEWQFAHDKFRQAVLHKTTNISALHQQVALAVEALYDIDAYAEMLMHHWQKAGDTTKELHYLLMVAEEMVICSARYEQARQLLTYGLTLGQPSSRLFYLLGSAEGRTGNLAAAVQHYIHSLAYADDEDIPAQVDTYNGLAYATLHQGNYAAAQGYTEDGLALSRQAGYERGIAATLNMLGILARLQGALEEARHYHEEALSHAHASQHQPTVILVWDGLATLAWMQGDYVKARQYCEQSLAAKQRIGDQRGIAVILELLGMLIAEQGDYGKARQYLEASLATRRQIQDRYNIVVSLINLAKIQLLEFDPAGCFTIQEILRLSTQSNSQRQILLGLTRLGWWQLNEGHPERAAEWLGFVFSDSPFVAEIRWDAQPLLERIEATLPPETIEIAMARGSHMTLEEATQRASQELE